MTERQIVIATLMIGSLTALLVLLSACQQFSQFTNGQ